MDSWITNHSSRQKEAGDPPFGKRSNASNRRDRWLPTRCVKSVATTAREGFGETKKSTSDLPPSGNGICVGISSRGKYEDEILEETGTYDYPATKRVPFFMLLVLCMNASIDIKCVCTCGNLIWLLMPNMKQILTAISGTTLSILISACGAISGAGFQAEGDKQFDMGNYPEAIAYYSAALDQFENDTSYYHRGNARIKLNDFQGAIDDYTKAISLNPQHASFYKNRASAKNELGDYQGAIPDFDKAIEINSNNQTTRTSYKYRGVSKELVGDAKGACADWKEASSLGDKHAAEWVSKQCQ